MGSCPKTGKPLLAACDGPHSSRGRQAGKNGHAEELEVAQGPGRRPQSRCWAHLRGRLFASAHCPSMASLSRTEVMLFPVQPGTGKNSCCLPGCRRWRPPDKLRYLPSAHFLLLLTHSLLLGTHSDTLLTYRKELLKGEERGKILKVNEKQGWGKKHYTWKENTFSKCRLNPIRIKISHIVLSLELINSVTPTPSPVIPPSVLLSLWQKVSEESCSRSPSPLVPFS